MYIISKACDYCQHQFFSFSKYDILYQETLTVIYIPMQYYK
jgi:hypothetical protein